jgi:hypothetical protein
MLIIRSQRYGLWFSHRPDRATLNHLEPRLAQVHACYAMLFCVAHFAHALPVDRILCCEWGMEPLGHPTRTMFEA